MIFIENFLRSKIVLFVILISFLFIFFLFYGLSPASAEKGQIIFEVSRGEGFFDIMNRLKNENLIRSPAAFTFYSVISGSARKMKPGIYQLRGEMNAFEIANTLSDSPQAVKVVIPDGATIYEIDAILSEKKILPPGFLASFEEKNDIEGKLFPDTYEFFKNSSVEDVVQKFLENFSEKAEPILKKDSLNYRRNLIIASLIQKEVPDGDDARVISGILRKRLSAGMKLDVDATICYIKKILKAISSCYPLSDDDFKIDSPYNTYLHSGLPPGPIGNPNAAMINAAVNPLSSPYWFYLSDPKTEKTIFAKTLDEQNTNRAIYLR